MGTKILVGDCLESLKELPDESVHCVVTSPPYWGLRKYEGDQNMIGLEPTLEEHIDNLVEVFWEVRRVLRNDGVLWLNYGDAHTSGGRKSRAVGTSGNMGHDNQDGMLRADTPAGLKAKDLMMMPERVAMALQADGWWLRQKIPWLKRNPMPESTEDRPGSALEFVYLLAKSGDALFWTHSEMRGVRTKPEPDYVYVNKEKEIETDQAPDGWKEDEDWKRLNRWKAHDYFYDGYAVRVRRTTAGKDKTPDNWDTGKGSHGSFHGNGREKGTIKCDKQDTGRSFRNTDLMFESIREPWGLITDAEGHPLAIDVPAKGFKGAHFATFPVKLIEPFIKTGTSEKGVCRECGAPWTRVVEKTGHANKREPAHVPNNTPTKTDSTGWEPTTRGTNRWLPTCEHDADPVPATVLDPFAGAGTVGLVAQRLRRYSVMIELSEEYAEMARERIVQDMPLFSQVELNSSTRIEIDEHPGMPEMEDA